MPSFFDPAAVAAILPSLLKGLPLSFAMVVSGAALGTLLALGVALVRLWRVPVLAQAAGLFVSFFRGTPFLVQLFLAYFAAPGLLYAVGIDVRRADPVYFAIGTFALNQAAFVSEIFRSAILAVDRGQREAALSVGMSGGQAFLRIVCPQAFLIALPGWGSSIVILFQETSLAFTIGVIDVMGIAYGTATRTYQSLESYAAAAIIFVVVSLLLEWLFGVVARRLGAGAEARQPRGVAA